MLIKSRDAIRHLLALGLAECLLAEHWVEKARRHLAGVYESAERDLGQEHATTIGIYFHFAQAYYKMHFFGREGYRKMLIGSIGVQVSIHLRSTRVLGIDHPLTRKVAAGFLRCFDEQLDWTLDDIPGEHLAYRARLLGN